MTEADNAIAAAVEGATEWQPGDDAGFAAATRQHLDIGSDVEIAGRVAADLRERFGRIIHADGEFWRYEATCWRPIPEPELRQAVHEYDGAEFRTPAGEPSNVKLSKGRVSSALCEMAAMLAVPDFFDADVAPVGINCASGFIQFGADGAPEVLPHDPDHRCRHTLPGRWSPDPKPAGWGKNSLLTLLLRGCFLGDTDAREKIAFLQEVAGACATGHSTRLRKPKAIVLKGERAENGKSQILDLLRGLLPATAICSIPPQRLSDERHIVSLAGKLLNASDELTSATAVGGDAFKSAITGEPMSGRDVYKSAVDFRPMALHVYATNDLPSFRGGMDRGVMRRLALLTFGRVIPVEERIEHIGQRIATEEADLLLDFAVQGARRLIARRHYAEPPSSGRALNEWALGADPVQAWLTSINVTGNVEDKVPTRSAYAAFREWATAEGYRSDTLPAVNTFSQRVMAQRSEITITRPKNVSTLRGLRLVQPVNDGEWDLDEAG